MKACQRVRPHKTPWFLILSVDNQIDRHVPRTCPLPIPFPLHPPKRWAHAVHPALQSRLFRPGYFMGRMRHWVVKRSTVSPRDKCKKALKFPRTLTHVIEISWPIFSEIRNLAFLPWAVFPQGSKWKKLFSSFICFCCFKDFFFLSRWSSFLIKVPFYMFGSQSECLIWYFWKVVKRILSSE